MISILLILYYAFLRVKLFFSFADKRISNDTITDLDSTLLQQDAVTDLSRTISDQWLR